MQIGIPKEGSGQRQEGGKDDPLLTVPNVQDGEVVHPALV